MEVFVPADRAAVRTAFLDADVLARWWWAFLPDVTYSIDPRPGGRYRIRTDTAGFGVHGEILTLGDGCAVISWVWEDGMTDGPEETVTIQFEDAARDVAGADDGTETQGTLVKVVHMCAAQADELREGWTQTLAELPKLFGPPRAA